MLDDKIMNVIRYAYSDFYEVEECINLLRSKNLHKGITYEMIEKEYEKIHLEGDL